MSFLSRLSVAAANFDFEVKKFFRSMLQVDTVAAAGSTYADATALTANKNLVTASNGAKGVMLPVAEVDMAVEVVNTVSTGDLLVYPNSGAQINSLTATSGAFTLPGGQDATFYCDAAFHWYVRVGNGASSAELEVLNGVTAGTTAPSKAVVLDAAESLVWATTDATASETVTLSIQDTRTGAGATGWTHKDELVSNVALGAYANASYGLVTFGASGRVTGLAAGICGEVELSAGTTQGTYASLEAELTANAAVSTGTDTGFIYANIAGSNSTGKTTINTNAHLLVLGTGVVDTTDGLFDVLGGTQAVTASARLRIKVGSTLYYLPVCAAAALTS